MQEKIEKNLYAAVDIGTNSIKLLIAEVEGNKLTPLFEKVVITRLGKGIIKKNTLERKQVVETLNAIKSFLKICHSNNIVKVFSVCTQALRTAENAKQFLAKCGYIDIQPKVISGNEEARLAYLGATYDTEIRDATVLDIGGGSTEIVSQHYAKSLHIGAVTLTEKFIKSDPPSKSELTKMRNYIRAILQSAISIKTEMLIGIGGTITTIAAINRGASAKVHKTILYPYQIKKIFSNLSSLTLYKRRKIKCLEPKRADIIVAGTLILIEVMDALKAKSIIVSTKGIRHGLLIDKLSCI